MIACAVELTVLFCPTCGTDVAAEAPPCPDGHGARCPDRACVECGTALLADLLGPLTDPAPARSSRARHAA